MKFQRQPLRQAIRREILTRMVTGTLPGGSRINETHLAEDLGLSRTPLREAMLTLAATGHLEADMGKGFRVPSLERTGFLDLCHLLALLQPAALSFAMPVEPAQLVELSNHLNRARLALDRQGDGPKAGQALVGLIFSWNETILQSCRRALLAGDVTRLEELAARYWYVAGTQGLGRGDILQAYQGLYDLIRQGHTDRACQVWAENIGKYGEAAAALLPD